MTFASIVTYVRPVKKSHNHFRNFDMCGFLIDSFNRVCQSVIFSNNGGTTKLRKQS